MKPLIAAGKQFYKQIWADAMLCALLFVPIIMGFAFRFGVPAINNFIYTKTGNSAVLTGYYVIFDLLLSAMTTVMFSAAGALVILDEADCGISRAYITSPVGIDGYLISRIIFPTVLSMIYCVAVTFFFRLSDISFARILLLSPCSGTLGVCVAMMVTSLAHNRVEGMAISKLSGLIMLGLPAALLLPKPICYIGGIFPSYYMTQLVMGKSAWNAAASILTGLIFIMIFYRKFKKKIL